MPQPFTLKHERSPDFRSGVADGAVVSIVGDQLGARVTITFTRMDASALTRTGDSQWRRTVRVCWNGSDCLASPLGST